MLYYTMEVNKMENKTEDLVLIIGEIESKKKILRHQENTYFPPEERQKVRKYRKYANERLLKLHRELGQYSAREIAKINGEEAFREYERSIESHFNI